MAQDSLSLAGKVAIITGSGKENGIGAEIALAMALAGAKVTINYVSESTAPRAAKVVAKIDEAAGKGHVIVVQADASTPEGNRKLVDETLRGFDVDHIDILVNNAAWSPSGSFMDLDITDIEKAFKVIVFGPMHLIQATTPHMPNGGRIINIGTVGSKLGISGLSPYGASKAAMDSLTFSLARELGRDGKGITVNTVAPGPVLTDMLPPGNAIAEEIQSSLIRMTRAEERLGTTKDVADVVLLLASEKSRWITGQFISASGGITGG